MRAKTYVTDMTHFLDDRDEIADMPAPAQKLAHFLGSIVEWVTSHPFQAMGPTNVRCRRNPRRKPCSTPVSAGLEPRSRDIFWRCPKCGENGVIREWECTPWDRSPIGDLN